MEPTSVLDWVNGLIASHMVDDVTQTQLRSEYSAIRELTANSKTVSELQFTQKLRVRETPSIQWIGIMESTPNIRQDLTASVTYQMVRSEEKIHWDDFEYDQMDEERFFDHIEEQIKAAVQKTHEFWDSGLINPRTSASATKELHGLAGLAPPLDAGEENTIPSYSAQTVIYGNGSTDTLLGGTDVSTVGYNRLKRMAATYTGSLGEGFIHTLMQARVRNKMRPIKGIKQGQKAGGRTFLLFPTKQFEEYNAIRRHSNGQSPDTFDFEDGKLDMLPVIHCPALDDLSDEPVFMVNSNYLYVRKGKKWMSWTNPVQSRDALTTNTKGLYASGMLVLTDPRRGVVRIHKPIAA